MKKVIILAFTVLFNKAFSQDVSYGVGGGINGSTLAKVPFSNATSTQGELGYLLYVFGEYKLSEKAIFHSKLGLQQNVVRSRFPLTNFFEFNYLSLMPSVKLDMGGQRQRGAFFKPGVRFSALLSAKDVEADLKVNEAFNAFNLGFNIGFGADFAKHYSFEIIADFGLTSEIKNSETKDRVNSILVLLNLNLESLLKK